MDDQNGRHNGGDQHSVQSETTGDDPENARSGDPLHHFRDDIGNLISVYQTAPDCFSGPAYVELCLLVAGLNQNPNAETINSKLTYPDFGTQPVTRIPSTSALEIEEGENNKKEWGWKKEPTKYRIPYLQYRRSLQRVDEWALDRSSIAAVLEEVIPDREEIPMYARMEGQVVGWLQAQRGDAIAHALLIENCRAQGGELLHPQVFPPSQLGDSGLGKVRRGLEMTDSENPSVGRSPLLIKKRTSDGDERTDEAAERKFARAGKTNSPTLKGTSPSPPESPTGSAQPPNGTTRHDPDPTHSPSPHMGLQAPEIGAFREAVERGEVLSAAGADADTDYFQPASAAYDGALRAENNSQLSGSGEISDGSETDGSENKSQQDDWVPEDSWVWQPDDLKRRTCEHDTSRAISRYVPEVADDDVLFRYCVYVLWGDFDDRQCGLQVLPESACNWIADYENDTAIEVIEHIQKRLGLEILPHIPNRRCRLIKEDGLPEELKRVVEEDVSTPPSDYDDRVYLLSGAPYTPKKVTERREEVQEGLRDERHKAPSVGAQKTFEMLNFGCGEGLRSGRLFSKMEDHLDMAFEYVRRMSIDPDTSKKEEETWEDWRDRKRKQQADERDKYFDALSAIADQHQPFYTFSKTGRTDRLFAYNRGVLDLPSEVRKILCQDFLEVDLRSAHLLIAAWLWDADEALDKLRRENYSIWNDLMEHYEPLFNANGHKVPEPGEDLYKTVKAALKRAVYSTVYGMHAPSIQAQVTKNLKDILGPEAGEHWRGHPIMAELLKKRDKKLREMEVGDVLHGPTGIRIEIEQGLDENGDGVDPKSAMATLAQSYEQAAMQVILELERERQQAESYSYFRVALWLHDGAYVSLRSKRARRKDLNARLRERCKELAVFAGKEVPMPAFFEVETVEPPSLPEQAEDDTASCRNERSNSTSSTSTPRSTGSRREPKTHGNQSVGSAGTESKEMSTSRDSAPPTDGADTNPEFPAQELPDEMPEDLHAALAHGFHRSQWEVVHGGDEDEDKESDESALPPGMRSRRRREQDPEMSDKAKKAAKEARKSMHQGRSRRDRSPPTAE